MIFPMELGRKKSPLLWPFPMCRNTEKLQIIRRIGSQGLWYRGCSAPIKISGGYYFARVCVKRTSGENRFYVHEVLPIKEGATPFNRAALETSVDSGGDTPSMKNILTESLYVKGILKSSRNQTETEDFRKWFGDWWDAPAHASKAVNADGTAKVVYHGSQMAFFNTFTNSPLACISSPSPTGYHTVTWQ